MNAKRAAHEIQEDLILAIQHARKDAIRYGDDDAVAALDRLYECATEGEYEKFPALIEACSPVGHGVAEYAGEYADCVTDTSDAPAPAQNDALLVAIESALVRSAMLPTRQERAASIAADLAAGGFVQL